MCSARAVDTWVGATDFWIKKWQRWFWQDLIEFMDWFMLCLLEKLPSFPTIFQKAGDGHQTIWILNLYTLKMLDYTCSDLTLDFYAGLFSRIYEPPPLHLKLCGVKSHWDLCGSERNRSHQHHDDLRSWMMCFLADVFLYQLLRWSSVCSQKSWEHLISMSINWEVFMTEK